MAKFNKGDRVRSTFEGCRGAEGTILGTQPDRLDCYAVLYDKGQITGQLMCPITFNGKECNSSHEDNLELLTTPQYTPISPKVGEKYRVLKKMYDGTVGTVYVMEKWYTGWHLAKTGNSDQQGYIGAILKGDTERFLTTEYLELVSEPAPKPNGYEPEYIILDEYEEQPINQSIIKKTMNLIKKALLSKDDKNLIKAGYMDDNMNLTSRGREALEFITFTENKAKLVEMAEAQIAEDKEDKE